VRLFGLAASDLRRSTACSLSVGLLMCGLICIAPSSASADDDAPRPAPRTAITIGGASVVLVAAKDKIYAFVDRIEDNAPIADAQLELDTAEGTSINMHRAPITMNKATAGLFVGPFNRAGHQQDAFMVTLRSSAGDGQEPAEITYTDIPDRNAVPAPQNVEAKLAMVAVSGSIGAVAAVMLMLWLRGGRRRMAARSVGTARAA
jgi:hypothetical protein